MKDKKNLMIVGIVGLVLVILVVAIFLIKGKGNEKEQGVDTNKQNETDVVKGQEEVTNVIKGYVDTDLEKIREYAKNNSKVEFTIKELKAIFSIDVTKFDELKYDCSQDSTFIKFNNDYQDYTIVLGCSAFYID